MFNAGQTGGGIRESITWATAKEIVATALRDDNDDFIKVVKLTSDKFVAAYSLTGEVTWVVVGTVASDGVITLGTPVSTGAASAFRQSNLGWGLARISDDKFVVSGVNNSSTLTAQTYTVSGTTATLDASATTSVDSSGYPNDIKALSTTRLATVYRSAGDQLVAHCLTVGSGSLTFDASGTDLGANSISSSNVPTILPVDSDEFIVLGVVGGNDAVHCTDNGSGTPPTAGTAVGLTFTTGNVNHSGILFNDNAGLLAVGSGMGQAIVGKYAVSEVSGATITVAHTFDKSGIPFQMSELALVKDGVKPEFVAAITDAGNAVGGIMFGKVINDNVAWGVPFQNDDDAGGYNAGSVAMLTATRGIRAYGKVSSYPALRVFDL